MIFGLFGGDKKRAAELIAATKLGDKEKVQQLLAKGTDVNAVDPSSGDTVLITAVDSGQAAVVDLLLEHRPNLDLKDNNGQTALFVAASKGNAASSILDVLLKAGANSRLGPTEGQNAGGTPLHLASALGANEAVRCLLSHKAPTDVRLPNGSTLMHSAAIGGDSTTIKIWSRRTSKRGGRRWVELISSRKVGVGETLLCHLACNECRLKFRFEMIRGVA